MKDVKNEENDVPHYVGHRERLREKFGERGGDALADYEMLELLLFRSVPRKDTKPIAKALMDKFNNLNGVLNAELEALTKIKGVGKTTALDIKIIHHASNRDKKSELMETHILDKWTKVIQYCQDVMGNEPIEQFRVLFLNRKNMLILDEIQQIGTVDHTPVYPAQVIKKALDIYATAMILVHNHPSGDPQPSKDDIVMTHEIQQAAAVFNITVHDHVIVAKQEYVSMKNLELM